MNKKILIITSFVFFIISLVSCDWQVPKRITVKTSPTFNASAGTVEVKLSDYLTPEKIKEMISGNEEAKFNVMEYTAGQTCAMTYLVHYPLEKISFDFTESLGSISESLGNLSFGDGLSENGGATVSIPEISQEIPQSTGIDIATKLIENVNNGMLPIDIDILVETGSPFETSVEIGPIPFEVKDDDNKPLLDNVVFGADSVLRFHFSKPTNAGIDYSLKIDAIELKLGDYDDSGPYPVLHNATLLASTDSSVPLIMTQPGGCVAELDMSGKILPTESYLYIKATTSGGETGLASTTAVTSIKDGSSITSAEGFSLENPISENIDTTQIQLSIIEGIDILKEATISEGSLQLSISVPNYDQWRGVTTAVSLNITQSGGLNKTVVKTTDNPIVIDLSGQTLNTNDIEVSGAVEFSIVSTEENPSKVVLPESENMNVSVNMGMGIQGFSSATVKVPEELKNNLSQTQEIPVPAEIKSWIKEIQFNKFGVEFVLDYGLPIDNVLGMNVKSTALTIDDTMSFERIGEETEITQKIEKTDLILKPRELENFDFEIEIVLPGYSVEGSNSYMTLVNIETGKDVVFGVKNVTLITDLKNVTIAPEGEETDISGAFPQEDAEPLDISVLADYLKDLEFDDIEGKIYLSSDLLKTVLTENALQGKVWGTFTEESVSTRVDMIGSESGSAPINFVTGPVFDLESATHTTELPAASANINFETLFNSHPADLRLNYLFSFDEITVTKEQIESLGESPAEISCDIVLVLPFKLNIVDGKDSASFDLSKLIYGDESPRKDLLNRTEPLDTAQINEFIEDASIKMELVYENNLGIACSAILEDINPESGLENSIKSFVINKGKGNTSVTLTKPEMEYMLQTVPFSPNLFLALNDDVVIPPASENPNIKITIKMTVDSKVDYTIELDKNSESEGE